MSEPPFKPPHRLAPIPGVGSPARGVVPVPPVADTPRKRVAIPPVPTSQPRRPADAATPVEEEPTPLDRWGFRYTGPVGAAADVEVPLEPVVELPDMAPLTVLFWQDTQYPQPANVPASQTFASYFFDELITAPDGDFAFNRVRLDQDGEGGAMQPEAGTIWIGNPSAPGAAAVLSFLETKAPPFRFEIRYARGGVGGDPCFLRWSVNSWEVGDDAGIGFLRLQVTSEASDRDMAMENMESVELVALGFERPNAAVRARVTYTAGKLKDVSFDCDWVGAFALHASRLEISRVGYAPDTSLEYFDAPVDIAATVMADAPPAKSLLQLTVPIADVEPDEFRELLIPSRARRVNLLLRYGDEGASGDAPLGQLFLAFAGRQGRAVTYIDAMSAREALFGVGLPVPAGAVKLVLSNRSPDTSVQLGVIWQLEN